MCETCEWTDENIASIVFRVALTRPQLNAATNKNAHNGHTHTHTRPAYAITEPHATTTSSTRCGCLRCAECCPGWAHVQWAEKNVAGYLSTSNRAFVCVFVLLEYTAWPVAVTLFAGNVCSEEVLVFEITWTCVVHSICIMYTCAPYADDNVTAELDVLDVERTHPRNVH